MYWMSVGAFHGIISEFVILFEELHFYSENFCLLLPSSKIRIKSTVGSLPKLFLWEIDEVIGYICCVESFG